MCVTQRRSGIDRTPYNLAAFLQSIQGVASCIYSVWICESGM